MSFSDEKWAGGKKMTKGKGKLLVRFIDWLFYLAYRALAIPCTSLRDITRQSDDERRLVSCIKRNCQPLEIAGRGSLFALLAIFVAACPCRGPRETRASGKLHRESCSLILFDVDELRGMTILSSVLRFRGGMRSDGFRWRARAVDRGLIGEKACEGGTNEPLRFCRIRCIVKWVVGWVYCIKYRIYYSSMN